ncbi:sigma-70 family RNA polymerase sigma factor [Massilia horti]|uniref:Sigma-70 family RNA polymerase sigma factor n=1 Tax=Massilia horti TaxID=2562153 RepID=A0A4Y9T568_9BURK|nr:sigma-70 family RNA polymerase sigma factor [Massilia horti]
MVAWVSANVIPFEAELRAKLRRLCGNASEVDDLIQDVYYRILKTEAVEHIREPKAFLMQTAKNILVDRFRREAVVSIDAVANLEDLDIADNSPSTERVALARAELKWVLGLVAKLPERCKQVFSARKIYGMSQNETAASLGISENIVEKEMMKGVKLVSEMVKSMGIDSGEPGKATPQARISRKLNV